MNVWYMIKSSHTHAHMLQLKTKIEFALAFFIINVKFEQSSKKILKRAYTTRKKDTYRMGRAKKKTKIKTK